ncbi:hypothetical protein I317_03517 [Kwoniella heveanensis CBS 569]|nr:hypothetical protein I317_03517 [Kwoniella heveanensis CBS 569]
MSLSTPLIPRHDMAGGNVPGHVNADGVYVPTSEERTAYQALHIPWAEQVKYGYYALYFLCGLLFTFLITNVIWKVRTRYNVKIPLYSRAVALLRLLTYPQLPVNKWLSLLWTFGPLGPNLLLLAGLLFVSAFTWINQYYYYPPYYGSAPLYLRSEWLAMATLPFVYVLGSKRNIISVLTGVSHEKLQVLHQGAAFNFTYMSLVHTIAAIIRARQEKGLVYATQTNEVYVSGFVALSPLLVLFVGALPPFRKSFYEAFYWVHIIMALFFAGALFWHGYKLLDSDAYMIATIVLFLLGVTWRLVMMFLDNPILHRATATLIDEETIKLMIPTLYIKWSPGQHVFIRFSTVRPLESHPFSIATVPRPDEQSNSVRNMVFLLKPLSGFTKTLFEDVRANEGKVTYKVLIDGPYGGAGHDLRAFDSVLVIAGGTGITWALSVLQDLAYYGKGQEVRMIWAVRHTDALSWFEHELETLQKRMPSFKIQIYVTRENPRSTATISVDETKEHHPADEGRFIPIDTPATELSMSFDKTHKFPSNPGRPYLPALIEEQARTTQGSLSVACCGPPSMLVDCSNAVTKAQIGILKGVYPELNEVFLKSESYGW